MKTNWPEIFGPEEWAWIKRLGSSISDPEEKKSFWETVRDKKLADPGYSVFTDFPKEIVEVKQTVAQKYCAEILTMLDKHKEPPSS